MSLKNETPVIQTSTSAKGLRTRSRGDARTDLTRRRKRVVQCLSLIVFLTLWQIVGARVNPILFATPSSVVEAFAEGMRSGVLLSAFLQTMASLAVGFALAAFIGVTLGILMGRRALVHAALNPYVDFFQATPLIGLVPLVVIWFGIGFEAEIVITFLLAVWVLIVNTTEGIRNCPSMLLDMARIYHASERSIVLKIAIPHAVPYIFAGLRIGLARSLIGVIIAQMTVSLNGLGGLIRLAGDSFDTASLLAAIISSSLVGVLAIAVLGYIRRGVAPWAEGTG